MPDSGADIFLAGIAGREFTGDFWPRILRRLRPDVVPYHHDDFFRPLDGPFAFAPNVRLARVPEEVEAVAGASTSSRCRGSLPERGPAG